MLIGSACGGAGDGGGAGAGCRTWSKMYIISPPRFRMSIGMPKSDMVVLERVTAKKRADYKKHDASVKPA